MTSRPATRPARDGRRPDRFRRLLASQQWTQPQRSWATFIIVLCATLIFLSVWAAYAASHTYDRYRQVDPGGSAHLRGTTYRVLTMRQSKVITDGDQDHPAGANATWVIADMQANVAKKTKTPCNDLQLVGPGKRTWKSNSNFFHRKLPAFCDKIKVGAPFHYQLIYQVPTKFVDQIYGVAVDDPSSPAPTKVIRP